MTTHWRAPAGKPDLIRDINGWMTTVLQDKRCGLEHAHRLPESDLLRLWLAVSRAGVVTMTAAGRISDDSQSRLKTGMRNR